MVFCFVQTFCTRQQSKFETNLLMKQQDVCKFNVVRFISTLNLFLSRNTFLKRVSNVEINSEKINLFLMWMFYGDQTY